MFIPCKIFSLAIFLLSFPFCLNLHLIVSAARSIISTKHSIYDYWSGRTDWSQHITTYHLAKVFRFQNQPMEQVQFADMKRLLQHHVFYRSTSKNIYNGRDLSWYMTQYASELYDISFINVQS